MMLNTTMIPQLTEIETLALVLGVIGAIGGFPAILKWCIYSFYRPRIMVFFPPVNNLPPVYPGGTVKASDRIFGPQFGPHIINKSGKTLKLRVEFIPDKIVIEDTDATKFGSFKVKNGKLIYTPFFVLENMKTLSEEREFPSDFFELALPFPYKVTEEFILNIIIYPKIHLSEFGLPRYIGEIELKPIKAEFRIIP